MDDNNIINQLIEDSQNLYTSQEFKDSQDYRNRVMEAEELLLGAIYQWKQNRVDGDFEDIAKIIDNLISKKSLEKYKLTTNAIQAFMDTRQMDAKSGTWYKLPDGLKGYINRSLDFDESLKSPDGLIPGFAVKMIKDGIQVIKSSLQGFTMAPMASVSVRKAAAPDAASSRLSLTHESDTGNVQIHLITENEGRLGVSLVFLKPLSGRITLRIVEPGSSQNSRILDSYSMNEQTSVNIPGLKNGVYLLHIVPDNRTITFMIHD